MKKSECLDPRKNPNKWLCSLLLDCVEDCPADGTKTLLREAIIILTQWIEPGLIDEAFKPWIDETVAILEGLESSPDNAPTECSVADPWE